MTKSEQASILEVLFETSLDGVWLVGDDRRLVDVNRAACVMLGYTRAEMVGLSIRDIEADETPEEYEEHYARIQRERRDRFQARHRRKDGSLVEVEVSLQKTPLHDGRVACFIRDMTAQRVAERRVAEAERLAALGTLVAGVAHEVNNPLAAVLAHQSIAIEELQDLLRGPAAADREQLEGGIGRAVESLREAVASSQRIARIVRELSVLGRRDPRRAAVSPAEAVAEALHLLPPRTAQRARISVVDLGAPTVMASPGQLVQVVVNLVANAADAIPAGRMGEVVVRLSTADGGAARIEVQDDGSGIAPAAIARVFEPFYTTRRADGGTGLGLAICQAIVSTHGGSLTVESEVGKGSTFRVELPAAAAVT